MSGQHMPAAQVTQPADVDNLTGAASDQAPKALPPAPAPYWGVLRTSISACIR